MRGYRVWFSLLVLIGLLIAPIKAESAPFIARELLDVTALPDVSAISLPIVTGRGVDNLWCDVDLTVITGGGAVQLQLLACLPDEAAASGCVDATDAVIWALGTSLTSAGTNRIMLIPFATAGEETTMNDVEIVSPIPAVWQIRMAETGSTVLTYTVDCMWW